MSRPLPLRVNMVSESDVSVQGHGVHTAYVEMSAALDAREDVELVRGRFNEMVSCDIVHFHTIGTKTWRKMRQSGVRKVVSAHVVPASFVGSIRLAKYWLFLARWYMSWYYNRADLVLAVSSTVAKTLRSELKVPEHKIEILYNSIDMQKYVPSSSSKQAARDQLGIPRDQYVVLGNGQVQPRKRLDTFVAMARSLPDVRFVWVGGIPFRQLGADYASMRRLMDNLPSNMTVTGVIPHEDVRAYYHAADVFCLPAEQENHPMCVLEAAGAGLPIVLRDIPEYEDTFQSDALYCRTDDEFIDSITLLSKKEERAKWTKGSQRIAHRFDSSEAAARLLELYRNLL